VLARFFTRPDERYFVRQLSALLGTDVANLSRELSRLESIGILVSKTEGRQKYYQANPDCPIRDELRGIAAKTVGLADVLRDALAPLGPQISTAFIYGSQASGKATAKSDVDLHVVGDVDEMRLHEAVGRAEAELGRAVNYRLMSEREYRSRRRKKDGFLARVLAGPKIMLIGDADGL
jgi:predicted nucleotidyltransferase